MILMKGVFSVEDVLNSDLKTKFIMQRHSHTSTNCLETCVLLSSYKEMLIDFSSQCCMNPTPAILAPHLNVQILAFVS